MQDEITVGFSFHTWSMAVAFVLSLRFLSLIVISNLFFYLFLKKRVTIDMGKIEM